MRWKVKELHDQRTRTRFLFLPLVIKNEARWLETASWVEEYLLIGFGANASRQWYPILWLDKEET